LCVGRPVISGVNGVGAIYAYAPHVALIFRRHEGEGIEENPIDKLPNPSWKDYIVRQVFFLDEFFPHISADIRGFDGGVVVVEVVPSNRSIMALEMPGERNSQCHGSECPLEVYHWPILFLRDVCHRIDNIPDGIMVSALVCVEPQHRANKIGVHKIKAKKGDRVVVGASPGDVCREW